MCVFFPEFSAPVKLHGGFGEGIENPDREKQ